MKASLRFRLDPPRHPLTRLALGCVALALLGLASMFALLMAAALLMVWLARRLWLRLRGPQPAPREARGEVLEGEFKVVRPRSELLPR